MSGPRSILHLDMDAFYASIEQRDRPELKGKPVIVGGSARRGVVSAASYEARRFGIHSAMPMARAMRLCPQAVVLPVRMRRYHEISDAVFEIFRRYTPLVEPLSLDEAFLDVTASQALFGAPEFMARRIKMEVYAETGLTVSAGVATNKFLAKIASDLNKPDGMTIVLEDEIQSFLDPLPVSRIWGVGPETEKTFQRLGIRTIGDVCKFPIETLVQRFGHAGEGYFRLARGIDARPVESGTEAKSIGHEDTYEIDVISSDAILTCLLDLSDRVAWRLRRHGLRGGTVTLKVKYADFTQVTRSVTLEESTDDGGRIFDAIKSLVRRTDCGRRPVRLLGVTVSRFDSEEAFTQPGLFDQEAENRRRQRLNAIVDRIRDKYGSRALVRSRLLLDPGQRGDQTAGAGE